MFVRHKLKNGIYAAIIVRMNTEDRLATKCFRGTSLRRAGNFSRWESAESLFQDEIVLRHLLAEFDELWQKQDFGTHSVAIELSTPVGWESTGSLDNYKLDDLEQFDLNRRSWGLRVKTSCIDLLAPQATELTLVFEFKSEDGKPVIIVHSIYPGSDVGELDGDVTEREQRVFFDWNHPGAV